MVASGSLSSFEASKNFLKIFAAGNLGHESEAPRSSKEVS